MPQIAIADGRTTIQQRAAADAKMIQDACNLVAIAGCFHRHLLAIHRAGIGGDNLINHPVAITFISKLNSLCRMTTERELAAFDAIDRVERGETAEYEMIPL
jgi:hypothetical protein